MNTRLKIILFAILLTMLSLANAQFYNGHQMTFGKNRVQYRDFYWQYFQFDKFETYFYVGGREIALYTAQSATKKITEMEYKLQYALSQRITFIIYNKQSDFRQSNIGLVTGNEDYNIGGTTRIIDNKVFIFYEGSHAQLDRQISEAVAQIMLNEMLFGGSIRDRVASSTFLNLPAWYQQGLILFLSGGWNFETENRVKDAMLGGRFKKFNRIYGDDAIYAGLSMWYYLAETYGESIIPNILYMTRVNKNVEAGFLYVLGMPLKDVVEEWKYYYESRLGMDEQDQKLPVSNPLLKRPRKNRVYTQIKISGDGNYISYVTNELGQYKIWIYDNTTKKHKRIVKKEHRLQQITDYSYPVLCWHPNNEFLTYITETKGALLLHFYELKTGKTEIRELFYVEKVLDYHFSPDGVQMAMSVVQEGRTDLWVFSLYSGTYKKITNDFSDELHPRFLGTTGKIIFSSNRINTKIEDTKETITEVQDQYDLFIYDPSDENTLMRLSQSRFSDETIAYGISTDQYLGLSNANGIVNLEQIQYDSAIALIDTSIHYRYFTNHLARSNYRRNIESFDFNPNTQKAVKILFHNGKYFMYQSLLDELQNDQKTNKITGFRSLYNEELTLKDSLLSLGIDPVEYKYGEVPDKNQKPAIDTSILLSKTIDINNYVFEFEKKKALFNFLAADSMFKAEKEKAFRMPKQLVYFTNFYTNYLTTQIDFGFLNNSYQSYTGGAVYFNPGFNVLTKIGAIDLFEDYKITGGMRLAGDFDANEFLISIENLKSRLDKQWIFHRQAFKNEGYDFLSKTHNHEIMYSLRWPFSQVASIRGTATIRHDRTVFLSTDIINLNRPNIYKLWNGIKAEYVFDNTISMGLNLYRGTRIKVFGEFFKQVDSKINQNLFVVGADVRHYLRIHRELVWANRFAWSSSFGNALLIYYLGGVDNWMNFSPRTQTFNYSVPIDTTKNFVYQTVATNMRGFSQNIRNGTSFALINSELRWPFIRYIVNRPLSNDFINNLMVIGFFDAGSAWDGWTPWNARNAYNYEVISNGPITVTIDKGNNPLVAGYGFGLRSRLLGYYMRCDWAWGIDGGRIMPRMFYFSLTTDF